ncbi:putative hydrolase YugF [Pullulanibacillus camelliae]|uniref:Putative hydrolase YugF n=1 Tax=Pullulanibacillus camelliae TaxID=1707096 RepID=A0A8J2YFG8_9BACL|nr:alpha/beta hydrolase [Pullulanibacillus camelliae]GGE32288.1 putative hydrolase YugF [Pullulanibacillus camelliae]
MSTITINHMNIYYEQYGRPIHEAEDVLVLIHGYLSSSFSFRFLIPYLQEEHAVLSIDLPGFGQSDKALHFNYSLHNYGRLVLDILERFEIQRAILIGHSMGGQIALQAGLQEPNRIKKIVGLAAAGYMGPVKRSLVWLSYLPFFSWGLKVYFTKKDIMENFLAVIHNRTIINEEMVEGYLKPLQTKAFYRSLVLLMRHREGDLSTARVREITQPVLLIWGEQDSIVPLAVGKRFAKELSAADLQVLKQTGHLLPEEKPKETALLIKAFIKQ